MNEIPHPFIGETLEVLNGLPASDKSKFYFIHLNHTNPLIEKSSAQYQELKKQGYNIGFELQIIQI